MDLPGRITRALRSPGPGALDSTVGAAALLLFGLLKTYGLREAASDENIYFYLASRAAEGLLPYRDAFFAHPPVHLLPATLLCLIFGAKVTLLKTIAPLAAAIAGLALWRVAREGLGRVEGLCTLALFLFAHDLLRASSHHTGVNLGVALLCLGLLATSRGRDALAGALIAGSALSAFYLAPAGLALALVRLAHDRRGGLRLGLTGLGVFLAVNLFFLALAGPAYWQQVYGYHLMKPAVESALWGAVKPVTFRNALLIWSLAMAPAALFAAHMNRRDTEKPAAKLRVPPLLGYGLAMSAATLLLLISLGRLYHFYFLAAFPGLALLGGHGYGQTLRGLARLHSGRAQAGHDRRTVIGLSLLLLAMGSLGIRQLALSGLSWYQKQEGEVRTYVWAPSPVLPAFADQALRSLFWRERRVIGSLHVGVTGYLWHESRVFEAAGELARAVDERLPPGGTLFGDSTSTPLVALLSGRRLTLDEADTNFMRFRSGVTPIRAFLERLDAQRPAGIILRPGRGVATIPEVRAWVETYYRPAAAVRDPHQGRYLLYLPR